VRQSRNWIGAIAWIAGPVQFVIVQLVVQSSWHTSYSWTANAISDLGAARCGRFAGPPVQYVCSPLHAVMNASTVVLAVLVALGGLLAGAAWGSGVVSLAARGLILVAAAGDALVGFSPEDVHPGLHLLGAFMAIGVGNAALILAGLIRRTSPLGQLRPFTVPLSVLAMAATWLTFVRWTPGVGSGGMERMAVFPLLYWLLVAGVCLLSGTPVRDTPCGVRDLTSPAR
jgi:hypothetical membrane protein